MKIIIFSWIYITLYFMDNTNIYQQAANQYSNAVSIVEHSIKIMEEELKKLRWIKDSLNQYKNIIDESLWKLSLTNNINNPVIKENNNILKNNFIDEDDFLNNFDVSCLDEPINTPIQKTYKPTPTPITQTPKIDYNKFPLATWYANKETADGEVHCSKCKKIIDSVKWAKTIKYSIERFWTPIC